MTEITNVTGTAFVVAEYRDEENRAVEPLYRDNVVSLFLSPESRRAADRAAAGFPLVKELVKLRTRYLDDMLDKQIAAGCRQVVVLGAGLDTRAVRKSSADVTYFEIDDKAILHQLKGNLKRFSVSFDYFATAMIAKTTGVGGLTRMTDNFERMHARWITGFDDITALADEVDLSVVEDVTTGELHCNYRPGTAVPVFGPYYSICTLASGN